MSNVTKWIIRSRIRIILIGMLISTIPLITLTAVMYYILTDNIGKLITDKLEMVVASAEERIESILARDIAVARMFATRPHMLAMIVQGDEEQMNMHLMILGKHLDYIEKASIVSTNGTILAVYPLVNELIGNDLSERDSFSAVKRNWSPHVSDLFPETKESMRYVFTISVPIVKNDIPIGVLILQPQPEYISEVLKGIIIPEGEIVVFDSGGLLVYSSINEDVLGKPEDISELQVVQRLLQGEEGFVETIDTETNEMLFTAFRAISDFGWGLIIEIPARIVMDPLSEIINWMFGITFLMLLIGGYFGYRWALKLEEQREYSARLEEQAREMSIKNNQLSQSSEEIKKLNEELAIASAAKSSFLANVSHELRTPMNSIIGFSQILEDGFAGSLTEKQLEYLNHINTSAYHLLSLINEILDLAKIEAGRMVLDITKFSLREILNDAAMQFSEKCRANNIQMNIEIDPKADIELDADKKRLMQIILNLLSNAVKFTPYGGAVKITANIFNRDEIRLSLPEDKSTLTHNEYLEISVSDTGPGIKYEDQFKLFKPFSQIDSTSSKKYEGTGLGLALIKKLIDLHGGRIWVESEYGKGSTFTFILPLL